MKIIFAFLLLISGFLLSQNQRFVYEYTFKLDTLDKDHVQKDMMNLDITKEGSNFYSALLISRDSLFKAQIEKGKASKFVELDFRKIKQPIVSFRVSKTYPEFETVFHSVINASNLAVKELHKMNWTILPDIKDIKGFKSQKATTKFGGRNWVAWFTDEIQIQDGPYKFHGLPGLILHVEDEGQTHIFTLAGSQNLDQQPLLMDSKIKEIFVTKERLNELWNDYKKDPAKNIKIMHGNSEMSQTLFYDSNTGNPLTKIELIRNKENRAKEFFKRFNNFIEKDLYR